MHSINSAVKSGTTIDSVVQLPAGDGRSITTLSGENAFVSLRYRRLGTLIELVAEPNVFIGGKYRPDGELGREVTDDEEDALSIAVDLEYAAAKWLKVMDEADYVADPVDFQTALDREFTREARQFAVAAE
jgi:hypothetical protein